MKRSLTIKVSGIGKNFIDVVHVIEAAGIEVPSCDRPRCLIIVRKTTPTEIRRITQESRKAKGYKISFKEGF